MRASESRPRSPPANTRKGGVRADDVQPARHPIDDAETHSTWFTVDEDGPGDDELAYSGIPLLQRPHRTAPAASRRAFALRAPLSGSSGAPAPTAPVLACGSLPNRMIWAATVVIA